MARFYGPVGYAIPTETEPGVSVDLIQERNLYGEVRRLSVRQVDTSEKLNDDLSVTHQISLMADEFALNHFSTMKYVKWNNVRWEVTSIEVKSPRLIVRLGGVYNGQPPISP